MPNTFDTITFNTGTEYLEAGEFFPNREAFPELNTFEASTVPHTTYNTIVMADDTGTSAFRNLYGGRVLAAPKLFRVPVNCKIIDATWQMDSMETALDVKAQNELVVKRSRAALSSAFQRFSRQIWWGTDATKGDATGFPGLLQIFGNHPAFTGANAIYGQGNSTTAVTDGTEYVWIVVCNPMGVQLQYGLGGEFTVFPLSEPRTIPVGGTLTATEVMPAREQIIQGLGGVQTNSLFGAAFLKHNITSGGTTSNLGYSDLQKLINVLPTGLKPYANIFMNRASLAELRKSVQTIYSVKGQAVSTAPWTAPIDNCEGIPIHVTDALTEVSPYDTSGITVDANGYITSVSA